MNAFIDCWTFDKIFFKMLPSDVLRIIPSNVLSMGINMKYNSKIVSLIKVYSIQIPYTVYNDIFSYFRLFVCMFMEMLIIRMIAYHFKSISSTLFKLLGTIPFAEKKNFKKSKVLSLMQ